MKNFEQFFKNENCIHLSNFLAFFFSKNNLVQETTTYLEKILLFLTQTF